MSDWIPMRPAPPDENGPTTEYVDPRRSLALAKRRWAVLSGEMRARVLAEAIFGGTVRTERSGTPSLEGHFQGVVRLDVPFRDIAVQRWRESVFRACAARDPVLGRIPLVFTFRPIPVEAE